MFLGFVVAFFEKIDEKPHLSDLIEFAVQGFCVKEIDQGVLVIQWTELEFI